MYLKIYVCTRYIHTANLYIRSISLSVCLSLSASLFPPPFPLYPSLCAGAEAFPILGRLAREGVKVDAYWADNACIDSETVEQVSLSHMHT
jgi:hypothetical protein